MGDNNNSANSELGKNLLSTLPLGSTKVQTVKDTTDESDDVLAYTTDNPEAPALLTYHRKTCPVYNVVDENGVPVCVAGKDSFSGMCIVGKDLKEAGEDFKKAVKARETAIKVSHRSSGFL